MASLSVASVTTGGKRGVQRGEVAKGEERRRRHQSSASFVLLFMERRDLLSADQRRAPTALPSSVVGAGAVFVVRSLSLWELVDGRQLVMVGVVIFIIVIIHTYKRRFCIVFYILFSGLEKINTCTVAKISLLTLPS